MSIAAGLGLALAKELIPDLIGEVTKGRKESVERVAQGVADVAVTAARMSADEPPQKIIDALKQSPVVLAATKEKATAVVLAELQAETRAQEIAAADRADARANYKPGDMGFVVMAWVSGGLAVITLAGLFWIVFAGVDVQESLLPLLGTVVMASIGFFGQVVHFWTGTTRGSDKKTDLMGAMRR